MVVLNWIEIAFVWNEEWVSCHMVLVNNVYPVIKWEMSLMAFSSCEKSLPYSWIKKLVWCHLVVVNRVYLVVEI